MLINERLNRFHGFLFEGDGGGGDGGTGKGGDPKKEISPVVLPDDVMESLRNLVKRSGDESEALKILYADNKNLRDKLRTAEEGRIGENMVAIDKEKAQIIDKVDELGGWDKLIEKVNGYDETVNKLNHLEKQTLVRQISNEYGYKFEVLNDLVKDAQIEIRKVKDDKGNEVNRAYIKTDPEGKEEKELKAWIEKDKEVYLPALQTDSNSGGGRRITRQDSSNGNSGGGSLSVVEQIKKRNKEQAETGNPLNPKTEK